MKIIAIVQARMGSNRLPGKVLKRIRGKPILWYVIKRLKLSRGIGRIVVATSVQKENDAIEKFCKKTKTACFRGSEADVLKRYYDCAKKEKADQIIRITADCPLIDPNLVDMVIKEHLKKKNQYTATNVESGRHFPRGQDVEIFGFATLERTNKEAKSRSEREHVTLYITKNPRKFKTQYINPKKKLKTQDIRLCVDYTDDFVLIKDIIEFFDPRIGFSLADIEGFFHR